MTEAEWLATEDVDWMLRDRCRCLSERKLLLFAVSCCRRIAHLLADERSRRAIEVGERWADGTATEAEVGVGAARAAEALPDTPNTTAEAMAYVLLAPAPRLATAPAERAGLVASYARTAAEWAPPDSGVTEEADYVAWELRQLSRYWAESSGQAAILRDIFGNPFRPVAFSPNWRTDTARALAARMYDSRDFSAMPILADALQDAGCDRADILDHCRDPNGVHVRGCWVVDLVLGKE